MEENLSEFVYIADILSKLFLDVGEATLASQCLQLSAVLLSGLPLSTVVFEPMNLDDMPNHKLPEGLVVPCHSDQYNIFNKRQKGVLESGGAIDSSQLLKTVLKLVDILLLSLRWQEAVEICQSLLSKRLTSQMRASVLMTLVKCFLKLRNLPACEAVLNRIAQEAEDIISISFEKKNGASNSNTTKDPMWRLHQTRPSSYSFDKPPTPFKSKVQFAGASSSGLVPPTTDRALGGVPAVMAGLVSLSRSVEYMVYRARCRLAGNDPEWSIRWLKIALASCSAGMLSQLGKIHYLLGRSYKTLCLGCRFNGFVRSELISREMELAELSEEHLRTSFTYFRMTDDALHQVKTVSRLVGLYLGRCFEEIALNNVPLSLSLNGKAESGLKAIESFSCVTMELAGDTACPMLLLHCLVNCAELSWILGRHQLAHSAWQEAQAFISLTYLRPEDAASFRDLQQQQHCPSGASKCEESCYKNKMNNSSFDPPSSSRSELCTPLLGLLTPIVNHSPGLMMRIHSLLSRIIRLAFVMRPSPLPQVTHLIASWIRMDALIAQVVKPLFSISAGTSIVEGSSGIVPPSSPDPFSGPGSYSPHSSPSGTLEVNSGLEGNMRLWLLNAINKSLNAARPVDRDPYLSAILSRPVISRDMRSRDRMCRQHFFASGDMTQNFALASIDSFSLQDQMTRLSSDKQSVESKSISESTSSGFYAFRKVNPFQYMGKQQPSNLLAPTSPQSSMFVKTYTSLGDDSNQMSKGSIYDDALNLLMGFEIVRRALSMEFGAHVPKEVAVKATEEIIAGLIDAVVVSVSDPAGSVANMIRIRSRCPGLWLSSAGVLVEAISDAPELERSSHRSSSSMSDYVPSSQGIPMSAAMPVNPGLTLSISSTNNATRVDTAARKDATPRSWINSSASSSALVGLDSSLSGVTTGGGSSFGHKKSATVIDFQEELEKTTCCSSRKRNKTEVISNFSMLNFYYYHFASKGIAASNAHSSEAI